MAAYPFPTLVLKATRLGDPERALFVSGTPDQGVPVHSPITSSTQGGALFLHFDSSTQRRSSVGPIKEEGDSGVHETLNQGRLTRMFSMTKQKRQVALFV